MEPLNPYQPPRIDSAVESPGPLLRMPRTLPQILAAAMTIFVSRLPAILLITLITWGPAELILSYHEYYHLEFDDLAGAIGWTMLAEFLVGFVAAGAVMQLGAASLRGESLTWWEALGLGLRGWPRLVGTRIIAEILIGLAAIVFILPGIYLATRLALAGTAAVLERKVGPAALQRSMELTQGRFWFTIGLGLLAILGKLAFDFLFEVPLIVFPDFGHWLLNAGTAWMADLSAQWVTLVFVVAYYSFSHPEPPAVAVVDPVGTAI